MFVSNMISNHGNKIPDQFVITTDNSDAYFQSYTSIIARRIDATDKVELDVNKWNYSKTTSKYLARFLGVPNKEIKQKVNSGEYPLVDLNSGKSKDKDSIKLLSFPRPANNIYNSKYGEIKF